MRKRPAWRLDHMWKENRGPAASSQRALSCNGHERAEPAQGDHPQAAEAVSDVTFWCVIAGGLCFLAFLTFILSGFWRGVLIGAVVGFHGGLLLDGLLRLSTGTPHKS